LRFLCQTMLFYQFLPGTTHFLARWPFAGKQSSRIKSYSQHFLSFLTLVFTYFSSLEATCKKIQS
jgi:hypothetical protein